jgi:predicted metal-binding protein
MDTVDKFHFLTTVDKFHFLMKEYDNIFLDWLEARFKKDVNIFKFQASSVYALEIMLEFEKQISNEKD